MPDREYARHALIGVAPPQTNPVVEAEFSALLPDGVAYDEDKALMREMGLAGAAQAAE